MAACAITQAELCAGGGMLGAGVKLGLELVTGWPVRTVLYSEWESYAAATLVARMEDAALDSAPVWSDLRTLDGAAWRGCVDIVAAGIPCQGNSLAGQRKLNDDPRNMWPPTRRLLRAMEPEWFFLENVYGFAVPDRASGREAPIARVLGELAEDGWDAEWDVFRAREVGAKHSRERVFVLAHRQGNDGRGEQSTRGARRGGRAGLAGSGEAVGDGERKAASAVERGGEYLPLFAPGRDDWRAWAAVAGVDATRMPCVERALRGVVDGLAPRVEQLRVTGNGVVPLQAAVAFVALWDRFDA